VAEGEEVVAGSWLVAVNDRPVLVLPGPFPLYRDLAFGAQGADVEVVQEGLRVAGLAVPAREQGTFGVQTQRAVAQLYERAGFSPPEPPPEVVEAIAGLEQRVAQDPDDGSARTALADQRALAGPRLVAAEVAVAGSLPATATELVGVGRTLAAGDVLGVLQRGARRLVASVPTAVAAGLGVGMEALVDLPGAVGTAATISALEPEDAPPGSGEGVAAPTTRVLLTTSALLPGALEAPVLVRLERAVVDRATAIVPVTAVVNRGGRSYVARSAVDGEWREVEVQVLGELAGRVAVEPVGGTPLVAGDQVLLDDG
jgi:hypothetical protein